MSTRNIHVNTASYTLLVAGKKKNTGEEWDVLEFSSLTELKKYRKSHPEKMAFSYNYALSQGVDTQFRHIRGQFGYRKLLYVKLIFYHFWFFWKRNILDVKTVMRGH
ncbi:hypothetical protein [Escherichia coli]|uniref:hypothetical protein n=1 Tax=Escherichia coli TaxID=562 RepID=UPI002032BF8B|nr:hypothetical protein [Escherichia coli]